jgi:nascent polypeptide-associated complex subunit alpha
MYRKKKRLKNRDLQRQMKRMGMNVDQIDDVETVTIKTPTRIITIPQPQVSLMKMGGQQIFQIVGSYEEEAVKASTEVEDVEVSKPIDVKPEDIQLVAQQAGVPLEQAEQALKDANGDLARAILSLK